MTGQIYLFFRKDAAGKGFFYPVTLRDDSDALANVKCNPGTVKVETGWGRVVWQETPPDADVSTAHEQFCDGRDD